MKNSSIKKLLLAGGGHAHIGLLRRLRTKRPDNLDIAMISEQSQSLYSGMLPGWMAGHYSLNEISIDVLSLCKQAGVDLIKSAITRVDANAQNVATADKGDHDYDILSLNTGADTDLDWLARAQSLSNHASFNQSSTNQAVVDVSNDKVIPIRPLHHLVQAWQQILLDAQQSEDYQLAIIGAGAAATEIVMAAKVALQAINPNHQVYLVCGRDLLSGFDAKFTQRVIKQLKRLDIPVIYERAQDFKDSQLAIDTKSMTMNSVIAATGVVGAAWTKNTTLKTVDKGFIAVSAVQQSTSHANVFAVGDVATRTDQDVAHSGVHAVHGGAVEANNLMAYLANEPLKEYKPRARTLYLLSCGDIYAIGSWGKYSLQGRWIWYVKRYIDKRFVASYK
ncbi:FAD-dependent oxidoreductase [Psychrobacter sp. DM4]|uniref:FAD-dependent oxidoreductase n=1 Tax=Psychrobacter sp. DM4 TaxID=3440637 RepID=UPI003F50B14D